jgi:hypothetical protein
LGEPSFRQLAAAPELISSSARVTTTTTPTSTVDGASSEEPAETPAEVTDMRMGRVLRAIGFVKIDSAYNVRLII